MKRWHETDTPTKKILNRDLNNKNKRKKKERVFVTVLGKKAIDIHNADGRRRPPCFPTRKDQHKSLKKDI